MSHFIYCYAECRNAEFRYAEFRYAEFRYAECRYAECHGALRRNGDIPLFLPGNSISNRR